MQCYHYDFSWLRLSEVLTSVHSVCRYKKGQLQFSQQGRSKLKFRRPSFVSMGLLWLWMQLCRLLKKNCLGTLQCLIAAGILKPFVVLFSCTWEGWHAWETWWTWCVSNLSNNSHFYLNKYFSVHSKWYICLSTEKLLPNLSCHILYCSDLGKS